MRNVVSYSTINQCANDPAFMDRVRAATAQELNMRDVAAPPMTFAAYVDSFRWAVATATDVEAAYASALAADNPNPGGDESVITDGMILSAVQAGWNEIVGPGQ